VFFSVGMRFALMVARALSGATKAGEIQMKLRRTFLASTAALGALALVAFSNQANAGAFAFADLQVNTFEVQGVTGNTLGGAPSGELTNANSATGGVTITPATTQINVTGANDSFASTAVVGVTSDAKFTNGGVACVGACPANPYAFQAAPPITSVFSQAAAKLNPTAGGGTFPAPVIDFIPIGAVGTKSIAGGATAETAAQTQLLGLNTGQASSTIGLNSGFNFSVNGAGGTTTIALTFNAIVKLIAGLDPAGGTSQASSALSFTVTDQSITGGPTVFSWAPDGTLSANTCPALTCEIVSDPFSVNTSATNDTTPGQTQTISNGPGAFEAELTLNNGDLYTFAINHQTQTLVTSFPTPTIPEPTTLALFGAGLLGLGWMSRRRKLS
jgi:PEP-CTERM motif